MRAFHLYAVTPDQLDDWLREPDGADHAECPDDPADGINLGDAWQGLHFLLTGTAWEGDPPADLAVLGGELLGFPTASDGSVVYLTGDRVAVVAEYLAELTPDALAARHDPGAMAAAEVMPGADPAAERDRLIAEFGRLREFYRGAAVRGLCVVKSGSW